MAGAGVSRWCALAVTGLYWARLNRSGASNCAPALAFWTRQRQPPSTAARSRRVNPELLATVTVTGRPSAFTVMRRTTVPCSLAARDSDG